MLKIKSFPLVFLSGTMIVSTAYAGEWSGEGELGFTSTSGNTESETLNAKLSVGKKYEKWAHNAKLALLKSSNKGSESFVVDPIYEVFAAVQLNVNGRRFDSY